MRLVECIPNFSEGTRPEVIHAIRDAIAEVEGTLVLDVSSDRWHNRTVITFVAPPENVVDAAFAAIREARDRIDLNSHAGVHPRAGAADVVPLVPLQKVTMEECVALAHSLGERVGRELDVPVYMYEHAALRPERRLLADVRRGGFEGIAARMVSDPDGAAPDYGPPRLHPTAGAAIIGARPVLVAFNVYLGGAEQLPLARRIARAVRERDGGLPAVRALALEVDGQAQVSMNLVDLDRTPVHVAWEAVRALAVAEGVEPTWSELVGLIPERALVDAGAAAMRMSRFSHAQLLERRILERMPNPE